MTQLALSFDRRRIDVTLERLDDQFQSLPAADRDKLAVTDAFHSLVIVSRLRGMEMAEEEVLGRPISPLADCYDRVAVAGENAVDALLRALREYFGGARR